MFRANLWLVGCLAFAMAGCGGYTPDRGVVVTGKVLKGGQSVGITPTDDGYNGIEVLFTPASPSDTGLASTFGRCNAAGEFEVAYEGEGIPPGKYKVSIYIRNGSPETDMLNGKLDPTNSTLQFDIPKDKVGGKHDVGTIDVGPYMQ